MRAEVGLWITSTHTHAGRERFKNKAKWWFINGELSASNRDCRYEGVHMSKKRASRATLLLLLPIVNLTVAEASEKGQQTCSLLNQILALFRAWPLASCIPHLTTGLCSLRSVWAAKMRNTQNSKMQVAAAAPAYSRRPRSARSKERPR